MNDPEVTVTDRTRAAHDAAATSRADAMIAVQRLDYVRGIESRSRAAYLDAMQSVQCWKIERETWRIERGTPLFAAAMAMAMAMFLAAVALLPPMMTIAAFTLVCYHLTSRVRYPYRARCYWCRRHPTRKCTPCRRAQLAAWGRRHHHSMVRVERGGVTRTFERGSRADLAERIATRDEAEQVHEDALLALFRAELLVPLHVVWPDAGFEATEQVR